MTTATDLKDQWDNIVDEFGNAVTLYDPTITYNDEGDVNAYTLGTGTSTVMVIAQNPGGTAYSSEVEGIDDRLSIRALVKTTESVDNETIILYGTSYFRVAEGSLREVKIDDTVIATKLMMAKMLPQEVSKIA